MKQNISASQVKSLREVTGMGMMDCKNALTLADGDMEAAKKALAARGAEISEKLSDRDSGVQRVQMLADDNGGNVVALVASCETDFVAIGETFKAFMANYAKHLMDEGVVKDNGEPFANRDKLDGLIQEVKSISKENIKVLRSEFLSKADDDCVSNAFFSTYNHFGVRSSWVLGKYPDGGQTPSLEQRIFAQKICMHLAGVEKTPVSISREGLSDKWVSEASESIKRAMKVEMRDLKDNPVLEEKIFGGKLHKHIKENVLLEQKSVYDNKTTIGGMCLESGFVVMDYNVIVV